jgi:O-antigen ligase
MTIPSSSRTTFTASLLRIGLLVAILATVVPYGAVNPFWFNLAVLLNALVFIGTLAIPFRNMELLKVYRAALILLLLIGFYLGIQSIRLSQNAMANPIWDTVQSLLAIQGGAISVNPAGTIATIPLLVHPFLIFMGTLVLNQSNDSAIAFWRRLSLVGGGIALFGLGQHFLFPHTLLLGEKRYYLDSVTGTFVNRNSAATLFGVSALLFASLLVHQFRELFAQRDQSRLSDRLNQKKFYLYLGFFLLVLLALFLTKSRGGMVATFVPLLLITAWFGFSLAPRTTSKRVRIGVAGLIATVLVLLFVNWGARSLFRFEQSGADDARWCVYKSTIAAISDNPWFGTGFGTFDQVFPAYRNPECGLSGVWDRAHNIFLEGYLGMGLPFAAFVIFAAIYLLSIFFIGYRARQRFRIVPLVGFGILLLIALHGMVDFSIQIPGVAAYVAAALGTAVAISLGRTRSPRDMRADFS